MTISALGTYVLVFKDPEYNLHQQHIYATNFCRDLWVIIIDDVKVLIMSRIV